ncbi:MULTISPECIES: helix-turn-helix domain-containing protein [unclassified Crossiella]|uniref:helix-turn-helix domain-containing protein n=1 Tax=unclassified Crossiella TaxID=2620835 RepID=UPI001FFFA32A|nr:MULTISPECIES: helix-turn-helix domain-containing protein [unclassified Crossiella]MCK2236323.1 helix-turn-helix domain-containing protein [Crossiella sp. S99.2]MCK2249990.1 helix-turn-helix domain-containing protein [Crossiella sp. S99.1]
MTTILDAQTVLPPDKGDPALTSLVTALSEGTASLTGPDGAQLPLPAEVYRVLHGVVTAMSQGLAVTIAPHNTQMTTQEAADLLDISRPTLVRLLTDGEIPFHLRGRHRRVLLADVLDYQERSRERRRTTLDEMTRTANEDGSDRTAEEFIRTR